MKPNPSPKLNHDQSCDDLLAALAAQQQMQTDPMQSYANAINALKRSGFTGEQKLDELVHHDWRTSATLEAHGATTAALGLIYGLLESPQKKKPPVVLTRDSSLIQLFEAMVQSDSPTLKGFPKKRLQDLILKPDELPAKVGNVGYLLDSDHEARPRLEKLNGITPIRMEQVYAFLAENGLHAKPVEPKLTRDSGLDAITDSLRFAQAYKAEERVEKASYTVLISTLERNGLPKDFSTVGQIADAPFKAKLQLLGRSGLRELDVKLLLGHLHDKGIGRAPAPPRPGQLTRDSGNEDLARALSVAALGISVSGTQTEYATRQAFFGIAQTLRKEPLPEAYNTIGKIMDDKDGAMQALKAPERKHIINNAEFSAMMSFVEEDIAAVKQPAVMRS